MVLGPCPLRVWPGPALSPQSWWPQLPCSSGPEPGGEATPVLGREAGFCPHPCARCFLLLGSARPVSHHPSQLVPFTHFTEGRQRPRPHGADGRASSLAGLGSVPSPPGQAVVGRKLRTGQPLGSAGAGGLSAHPRLSSGLCPHPGAATAPSEGPALQDPVLICDHQGHVGT